MLRYYYQKQTILEDLLSDSFIDLVADKVIDRIEIKADISDIIAAFDEIEKRLKELGG